MLSSTSKRRIYGLRKTERQVTPKYPTLLRRSIPLVCMLFGKKPSLVATLIPTGRLRRHAHFWKLLVSAFLTKRKRHTTILTIFRRFITKSRRNYTSHPVSRRKMPSDGSSEAARV